MLTALSLFRFFHFSAGSDAEERGARRLHRAAASIQPSVDEARAIRDAEHRVLVERVRANDEQAFETLFREFYPPLCTYVESLGQSPDAAEDIVEEMFLRLWTLREHWSVKGSVASYLYVAAKHQTFNAAAKDQAVFRLSDRVSQDGGEPRSASGTDADRSLDAADHAEVIQRAVSVLPDRSRQVFLLYYRDDLSYSEIAERLGVARKTVENQLSRALKILAERLRKRLG
jgi:RNA polymerase sigma-70 factor, ECF subfamily